MGKKADNAIAKAMDHPDVPGAGAKKRRKLKRKHRATAVMKEYARGTLRSGSGEHVTSHEQAVAIAVSESKKKRKR